MSWLEFLILSGIINRVTKSRDHWIVTDLCVQPSTTLQIRQLKDFSNMPCAGHSFGGTFGNRKGRQVREDWQDRQFWHLNLTFQVTWAGRLSQILRCFIQGMVWITRSTWEERGQLINWSLEGTIEVNIYLDKKEANKSLQRNTSKEEPKMLEWIPNKEHPYYPLVILMIRAAYKSRELPYDSHDVTLVNEDGLQFQRCARLFLQRWVLKEEHSPNHFG